MIKTYSTEDDKSPSQLQGQLTGNVDVLYFSLLQEKTQLHLKTEESICVKS